MIDEDSRVPITLYYRYSTLFFIYIICTLEFLNTGRKTCAAYEYCQLQSDGMATGMMACNHCNKLFHKECVFFMVETERIPESWACGCSTIFSEIK
jgi:hypothetical protein